jgi:hypothetical protein
MHSSNQIPNKATAENNQTTENNVVEASNIQENLKNLTLNSNAKVYVPRKTKATTNESNQILEDKEEKLNLNLNAEEFKPKNPQTANHQNPYQIRQLDDEEENEEEEDLENEELDMIVNDLVENDAYEEFEEEDESDDEKWFPKYKDCECCKGFIYKCKGSACVNMGACYCKMKEECDDEY